MVRGLNRVFLMGNLTRDPELRYTPAGSPVTNFSVAINRNYVTQSGERKEETCFVRITVWGKQAESCAQYLSKGRAVFIEGRLQSRSWEAENGQRRNVLEVVASSVQFIGGKEPFETKEGVDKEEVEVGEEVREVPNDGESNKESKSEESEKKEGTTPF